MNKKQNNAMQQELADLLSCGSGPALNDVTARFSQA
jgi:hypothetical protein